MESESKYCESFCLPVPAHWVTPGALTVSPFVACFHLCQGRPGPAGFLTGFLTGPSIPYPLTQVLSPVSSQMCCQRSSQSCGTSRAWEKVLMVEFQTSTIRQNPGGPRPSFCELGRCGRPAGPECLRFHQRPDCDFQPKRCWWPVCQASLSGNYNSTYSRNGIASALLPTFQS